MAQAPRRLFPQTSPRHAFGAAVREWRERHGWSQADLGARAFVSADLICKIEKAQRWPGPELITSLETALGAGGALVAFGPAVEAQRLAPQHARSADVPVEQVALDWLLDDEPGLRVRGDRAVGWIDAESVEAVVARLEEFRQLDHVQGAGMTFAQVTQYADTHLAQLLAGRPASDEVAVRLYRTAAGFWELAGYQAIDSGHDDLAQGCYLRALQWASAAGDRLLGGYLLAVSTAHLALHRGDVALGLRMARTGLRGTRHRAGPLVRSAFTAVAARAHARQGDEQAATEAILAAEHDLGSAVPGEEPGWIRYFSPAYLADETAHAFHDLGRPALAQQQADDAILGVSRRHVRRLAIDQALKASSLARAGQVEEACAVGRSAADHAAQTSSARTRQRLADVRDDLAAYRNEPAVRDFTDYVRDLLLA
ncbi:helix-turn-helix domain-containing protein [Longispora albida]|uniref:helix-turn-helix domain-containing protein n=1 Tax=Longispora albida TaxID=203523 RepID=UPI00039A67E8|nr:helix-turn-helix transcriptional regulator [Longispora albida]